VTMCATADTGFLLPLPCLPSLFLTPRVRHSLNIVRGSAFFAEWSSTHVTAYNAVFRNLFSRFCCVFGCSFMVLRKRCVVFLCHKVSSTWFLSTHVLNLLRMSIPSTLGVYRSIFSLSLLVVLGGMQTIVKLLHGILYSSLLDLKVRVTRLFISLFLKSPPKPTASRFE